MSRPRRDSARHPGRPRKGGGLCGSCYQKSKRGARRERERQRYTPAANRRKLLAKYGLTPEAYGVRNAVQAGLCLICGRSNGARALAVDHDHSTGVVRGLLCSGCNIGLGAFDDSPELLRAAATYLEMRGLRLVS